MVSCSEMWASRVGIKQQWTPAAVGTWPVPGLFPAWFGLFPPCCPRAPAPISALTGLQHSNAATRTPAAASLADRMSRSSADPPSSTTAVEPCVAGLGLTTYWSDSLWHYVAAARRPSRAIIPTGLYTRQPSRPSSEGLPVWRDCRTRLHHQNPHFGPRPTSARHQFQWLTRIFFKNMDLSEMSRDESLNPSVIYFF